MKSASNSLVQKSMYTKKDTNIKTTVKEHKHSFSAKDMAELRDMSNPTKVVAVFMIECETPWNVKTMVSRFQRLFPEIKASTVRSAWNRLLGCCSILHSMGLCTAPNEKAVLQQMQWKGGSSYSVATVAAMVRKDRAEQRKAGITAKIKRAAVAKEKKSEEAPTIIKGFI
jgi:hypothetical protein